MCWGNAAQWVSAAAVVFLGGFALWQQYFVERALEFDREYEKRREHIATVWHTLREQYSIFRQSRSQLPQDLARFVRLAAVPPGLLEVDDLRAWRQANSARLTEDQEHMLAFASAIYPQRTSAELASSPSSWSKPWEGGSITNGGDAEKFHEARGTLAWFWAREGPLVFRWHLRWYHWNARDLLILLSWLEITLQERTNAEDRGKVRLFRVLRKVWK